MIRELINEAVEEILEKNKLGKCPEGTKRVGKKCVRLTPKELKAKKLKMKLQKKLQAKLKKLDCPDGKKAVMVKGQPKCIEVKECPVNQRFNTILRKCVKIKTKH